MSSSALTITVLAGLAINIGIAALALHKIRRVHLLEFRIQDEIRAVAYGHLVELSQQLQALASLQRELGPEIDLNPTRGWAASPDILLLVARHVRATNPTTVVECGSGTSSVVVARSLQLNGKGHLFTLDHEPKFAEATRKNLARQGLSEWATVIDAPLTTQSIEGKSWDWYSLDLLPDRPIDVLVVDGPPGTVGPLARYPAGPRLIPKLAETAAVFVDDAARHDERECVERWLKSFPRLTRTDYPFEKGCAVLSTGA